MTNLILFFVLSFLLYWIITTLSNAALAGRNMPVGGSFSEDFKGEFYKHGSNFAYVLFIILIVFFSYLRQHGVSFVIATFYSHVGLILGTLFAFWLNKLFFRKK